MAETPAAQRRIRVLVVDDSAFNRQTIAQILETDPQIEVVGRAADGEEALARLFQLQPDVVTLDLEMPEMDGFSFMRLVLAQRPTPIIVISGLASRENVFRALELGALDFVAKPSLRPSAELRGIESELLRKIKLVTQVRVVGRSERSRQRGPASSTLPIVPLLGVGMPPERILAIGASTGGPLAIQQLLAQLDRTLPISVVVTQHMPPKFTTTFAERLQRTTGWRVDEAKGGETLVSGQVFVAPGGFSLALRRQNDLVVTDVVPAAPDDLFIPSVDRMFTTAASAVGERLVALVLTGMGTDGARGARAVHAAGGKVVAESQESAVVFGMPQEVIDTGLVDEVLSLSQMPQALARLLRG